ncbi:Stk1 family PASTA domain-containing Ser/Thr kinase [Actinomyces minihominis]|uniref:Stk1 family PASTA domain-containing Ser/Thr kinase n=1 Tax=Actinomyces minihominis TaxID=2002838 RepID=UPI000C08D16F|nr:Stk1 family PASTA domain-containing Ser/Thr kinase [Actinomyces minihominis]
MADTDSHLLGGRYEIRSLIGRGGMAQVHLGRDTRLSRLVAIKMLRVDLARDAVFQTRFRREAQASASLNHPNIVAVYDTGDEPVRGADGKTISVPYIVMEYVEGHTVKELLGDATPVPIPEAVEITSGVLNALQYAHNAGLVHRDIKPGNVMLTNSGKVKVMDFGIARAMADSQATMTQTNAVIGTAQYLSPEQARGETVDERSDIYSAGCLLFELLTGQAPFNGDSAVSLAYQHVSEPPPLPSSIASDIPTEIDRVVMKALAKEPGDRYASASAMEADLVRASKGLPIQAPPLGAFAAGATMSQTAVTQQMGAATARPSAATQTMQYMGPTRTGTIPPSTSTGTIPTQGQPPKKKRGMAIFVWLLVALAAAMVGTVIYVMLNSNSTPEVEVVEVPNVVGSTQAEAKLALEERGLIFSLDSDNPVMDTDVPEGNVAATNPESGREVEVGTTVLVRLSGGASTAPVPETRGMTLEQATAALEAEGFKVANVSSANDPEFPKDTVIRSSPAAGTTEPKGAQINLTVSSGNVEMPSTVGMALADAVSRIEALKGIPSITYEQSDSIPEGAVISMTPTGVVPQGQTIFLVVSSGPPPTPEPPQSGADPATGGNPGNSGNNG